MVITPPQWRRRSGSSPGKSSSCRNDGWTWWKMSNTTAVTCRSLSVTLTAAALFVCWLCGNEEKCKNQSICLTTKKKVQDLAGSPCWPFLKNEGKSKLIIILKACPGDAFCCDTSIYQSSEDPPRSSASFPSSSSLR